MARKYSFFPPYYNLVKDDPDLILLHCHYYKSLDTLFLLYKNIKTGEKILDQIEEPKVVVYIAKRKPKRNQEYIPIRLTDRVLVSYKNKSQEIKEEIFEYTPYKFKDKKTGRTVYAKRFPEIPPHTEAMHPSLFLYDVPIEQLCFAEFAINRYEELNGMEYANIHIPELDFASFDIETSRWPDGHWSINTNTFISQKEKHAYLDFVRNVEKYNRQQEIIDNKDKFIQAVRDIMENAIENSKLKNEKERKKVQDICREIMRDMKFFIRDFATEEELILETTKNMFTNYKPDILMAFNTTYDIGMFADRIRALELPAGTMNERGIGFDDVLPPYDTDRNRDKQGKFIGDTAIPKKRKVYLNNISHTMITDLQTCYYSARQGSVFSSYKLDALAEMVLGFGKFDYSFITNDILKLAEKDFWYHSIYALCDSILLLMINKVTDEFMSKMNFVYTSKCNIEDTSQSNSTITRSFHTDAFALQGMVPGCNINKILKRLTKDEVKQISNVIGIDYTPDWNAIIYRSSYGGGIVSNPNLYDFDFSEFDRFNILEREAHLTMFKKMLNSLYLDFKSHYPTTFITRNLSKGTLYGRFESILAKDSKEILLTRNKRYQDSKVFKPHLGGVSLSIANDNIISYANIACNLPSLTELADLFTDLDSEPLTKPIPIRNFEAAVPTKYHKLCSLLSRLNQLRLSSTDEESVNKDNKMFHYRNGSLVYLGTLVTFNYDQGKDLLEAIEFTAPPHTGTYGLYTKKTLVTKNEQLNVPKNKPFYFSDDIEFKEVSNDILRKIYTFDIFSDVVNIDGQDLLLSDQSLYFPLDYKIRQLNCVLKGKNPYVSNLEYRRVILDKTTKWEFKYYIEWEDVKLEIRQQMQTVNINISQED